MEIQPDERQSQTAAPISRKDAKMPLFGHFYFSAKQKNQSDFIDQVYGSPVAPGHTTLCELEDDGQICEYTEMHDEPIDFQWDDGVYLGPGIVHSVNGVRQF